MCETTESISISGSSLAHLLPNTLTHKEGFLYGDVEHFMSNRVSDVQYCNMQLDVSINVKGILPAPGTYLFYTSLGRIKREALSELLSDSVPGIIGWYRFRENNSLKPTLRDRLVCKGLRKYFEKYDKKYFIFCNITCKRNTCDSTHIYTYRFSKIKEDGQLEPLQDVTGNLGENVSGYKRVKKCDADDTFNKAISDCSQNGNKNVSEVVNDLLRNAADEFVSKEAEIREIEAEVQQMTTLLADHYRAKIATMRMEAELINSVEKESKFIKPIIESVSLEKQEPAEPFEFITDIIKSNLKPNEAEALKTSRASENSVSMMHVENVLNDNNQLEISSSTDC